MRFTQALAAAAALLTAATLGAQQAPTPPAPRPPAAAPAPAHPPAPGGPDAPKFDPAAVERGRALQVTQCGFCHGSSARGGQQGPDLTRSALVQSDESGQQLGAFLKVGRPEKNMPAFPNLSEAEVMDLATFLHSTIESVADRGKYKILNILVGDPKKGQAFFGGAGKCATCHSPTGDLAGVASRYEDPVVLQGRIVMPRGGRRRGPPSRSARSSSPSGADGRQGHGEPAVRGVLHRSPDARDRFRRDGLRQQRQRPRTWIRHDGSPRVVLTDPLQAHIDLWRRWTDDDLHNMTAFLATLK